MVGRRERIRTSGPHVPNVVLYQAELLSGFLSGRPYSHGVCPPQRPENAAKKAGIGQGNHTCLVLRG